MKPTLFGRECLKPQVRAFDGSMQYQLTIDKGEGGGGLSTMAYNQTEVPLGTDTSQTHRQVVRIYAGLRETAALEAQKLVRNAKLGEELGIYIQYIQENIFPRLMQKYLSKQDFGPEDISPEEAATLRNLSEKFHNSVNEMISSIDTLLLVPGSEGKTLQRVVDKDYSFGNVWKPVE